jgi:integration host factor subunit beta
MTRCELIRELTQQLPRLSPSQAETAVKAVFAALTEALAHGERVELRDFGSFGLKQHRARAIRDPRTGATIAVPAKTVPFFRVAKALRRQVEQQRLTQEHDGEEGQCQ